ncbi:hypothetical protein SERLA73DRAFT_192249 [Serpula lacrymans var. lacrymans S7.3]|uniref:Uncharacterized protein n=2 Tax=Serpula lacrymans var. lacrymans TaxID=341189 RepID=F8QJT2_SERL3|nr:uncharacterized protein SERLADRAFT_454287 [Serpula lacrymans var. lacrymans S7.9]XP_007324745.1 uncharacterized protein SERLADRAFT_481053 [Serpula lacrymans var. lacrymans S7.9]XP_007324905.1 uncharacterized protein SERLADRAFT_481205 [Serpula lacrymans var. lacrymans S7.9]EGN91103.1 hypothetical protein SERLA73DRAFT_173542 [Serpula lacrymans var. lacrymans S7.3]EGN91439.1 hypothetical protein SERLA73DRAFT_173477 [Serpula lacrymans var. lacrymans S7.3]EGN91570.1 hypothetical protein SERLA73D
MTRSKGSQPSSAYWINNPINGRQEPTFRLVGNRYTLKQQLQLHLKVMRRQLQTINLAIHER